MTSPGERRRPQCQKCGSPMAGHKRPNGYPVCPLLSRSPSPSSLDDASDHSLTPTPSTYLSSLSSIQSGYPPNTPTPTASLGSIATCSANSQVISEDGSLGFHPPSAGPWHWTNPNWTFHKHYNVVNARTDPHNDDDEVSVVSTEVVSSSIVKVEEMLLGSGSYRHGNGLYTRHLEREASCEDILQFMEDASDACVSVYAVTLKESEKLALANQAKRKNQAVQILPNTTVQEPSPNSYWVVLGSNAFAVEGVAEQFKVRAPEPWFSSIAMGSKGSVLQVLSAGLIGVMIVIGGLTLT